jgi:hypothetical protein
MTAFHSRNQRGVALPLALFTLVIAAVMITAVFYVGRLEQRMGNNSVAATQAFEAAETGITQVMDNWSPSTFNPLAPGTTVTLPTASVGANATYTASVRRLNSQLYLVQAEGRYLVGGQAVTRRQVARIMRLHPFAVIPEGALITRLGLSINGTAQIDGDDDNPVGWGSVCSGSGPDAPAVVDSAGTASIAMSGPCTGQACLSGSPRILDDPVSVTTANFNQLGGATFAALAASADKVVGGTMGTLGPTFNAGACQTSDQTNWGSPDDPTGPCGGYFPIIYSPGDLELRDGNGQGILLVDGTLLMTGNARFYGIVLVRNTLQLLSGSVTGTLNTNGGGGAPSLISGTHIGFSRCAIQRASSRVAQVEPMRERGWMQLY